MRHFKRILVAFLAGAALFIVLRYFFLLHERNQLIKELEQTIQEVQLLESQKQNLLQDLEKSKQAQAKLLSDKKKLIDNLRAGKDRINRLFTELHSYELKNSELNTQNRLLKSDNAVLNSNLSKVKEENSNMEARLSSVEELKKAIRDIKRKKNLKIPATENAKTEEEIVIKGNSGFIVKDGEPTSPEKIKIEVVPVPSKEEQ